MEQGMFAQLRKSATKVPRIDLRRVVTYQALINPRDFVTT